MLGRKIMGDKESSSSFKIPEPLQEVKQVISNKIDELKSIEKSKSTNVTSDSSKLVKDQAESNSSLKSNVTCPYKEPDWSGSPPNKYSFEVIKNGTFISVVDIKTSKFMFGRLDICHVVLEHPSVSRFHAVVQYCKGDDIHPRGFYLYDLNSTHGTFLNKEKIKPNVYYKLKVGYIVKFGGSTRLHIFQGPEEEEEIPKEKDDPVKTENVECSWGLSEDAEEEDELGENPFALSTPNEDLYLEDPKKTLKGWFEREGYDLEYVTEEKGFKSFVCRVQLPIDNPMGDFVSVEATVSGKKKEAVVACALEACRTLDRYGLLRQSHQESRQQKKKKWEDNDFYDSDEDTYLDRTGTIEKKRELRKRIEKKSEVETFQSLELKLKAVLEEISDIEKKLSVPTAGCTQEPCEGDDDSLEMYMSSLKKVKAPSDKVEKSQLKFKLAHLEKSKRHLEKLLEIAKPTKLPPIAKYTGMIGKRLKSKLNLPVTKPIKVAKVEDIEEDESEDENQSNMKIDDENNESNMKIDDENNESNMKIDDENNESNMKIDDKNNEHRVKIANECENYRDNRINDSKCEKDHELTMKSDDKNPDENILDNSNTNKPSKQKDESNFSSSAKNDTKKSEQTQQISKRVMGPTMPSELTKKNKQMKKTKKNVDVYSTNNSEYSMWVPPTGQSGDGKTHLNDKFGY